MNISDLITQLKGSGPGRIKKKVTTNKNQSPSVSKPHKDTPEAAAPIFTESADVEEIKNKWPRLIDFVRANGTARLGDLLNSAEPIELTESALTLRFAASAAMAKNLCESNGRAEQIQSLISSALGKKIRVAYELSSQKEPNQPVHKPRGARTSQKQINSAANTPAIKAVLRGLDANITDVTETGQ